MKRDVDSRPELSRTLVALRTVAGLRQVDVVASTKVSQAQLSRIERGQSLPTEDEARALGLLYGADETTMAELAQMAKDARAGIRDTRLVVQRGNTLAMQQRWSRIEREARVVRSYQPSLVLGVLQTVEYASVVLRQAVDSAVVHSRNERHQRMLNDSAREHVLIQTEGAIRRRVGSDAIAAGQVRHIAEASRRPHVRIGVIPESTPTDVVAGTGFHIYDDAAVVVGLEIAAATLTEPADVAHFRALFDRLAAVAVWDDAARSLLERVRASIASE